MLIAKIKKIKKRRLHPLNPSVSATAWMYLLLYIAVFLLTTRKLKIVFNSIKRLNWFLPASW